MRLSKSDRARLQARFGGRCAYCGHELGARWHADHVEPIIRETRYERGRGYVQTGKSLNPALDCLANLMPACAPCNISKGTLTLEGWRLELGRTLDILRRNYPLYRTAFRMGFVAEVHMPVQFWFEMPDERESAAPKWLELPAAKLASEHIGAFPVTE